MGKHTRPVPKERMSQRYLDSLITTSVANPQPIQRDHVEPRPVLSNHEEYDTMHPESKFREFTSAVRDMLSRYEGDKAELETLESQMQDLLHFIEMSHNKNANAGYKLYKQLCEVRRKRRICKNEIDLLQPVYDAFHDNVMLNKLSEIQGKCRSVRQITDGKCYTVRTDILEGLLD